MRRSIALEARQARTLRIALMGGAALFALGVAIRAHAQEAPSAPQQPAEQQQQRPAAQPAPPDQPPAQQAPA